MSASGQTLRSWSSPTAQFVRRWSDSDHTFAAPWMTLRPQAEFDQFHQGLNAVQSTAAAMK